VSGSIRARLRALDLPEEAIGKMLGRNVTARLASASQQEIVP
jgi:hypothetical protein